MKKTHVIKHVKSFTVRRRWWCRGERDSALLRHDGLKCCLGFFALAAGVPSRALRGVDTPMGCDIHIKQLVRRTGENKPITGRLIAVNDDPRIADPERKVKLRALFRKMGVRVKFV